MKKNTLIIAGVLVAVLVAGAGLFFMNGNAEEQPTGENVQRETQAPRSFVPEGATAVSIDAVTSGETVTIIGSTNSDGSINASTILLGDIAFNSGQTPPQGTFDPENPPEGFEPPAGFEARQPPEGFEDFQNLSEEERQARFEELRASGEFPGGAGGFPGGGQRSGGGRFQNGTETVRGTVLSRDDTTITVALAESGSRLVFYSSATEVFTVEN